MIGKYAELKKGKLNYQGRIDLAQYYVVDHDIMDFQQFHGKLNENWDVQVNIVIGFLPCKIFLEIFFRSKSSLGGSSPTKQ